MKKIISMALLVAMLLSCFAGCAMQKGELDVDNYAADVDVENVGYTAPAVGEGEGKVEVALKFDGTKDMNTYTVNKLSGASDKSWKTDAATYTLDSAADVLGFFEEIQSGNSFAGKTINLAVNADLNGAELVAGDASFAGTFNGNGYFISGINLYAGGRGEVSLFGKVNQETEAIIKNVSIINSSVNVVAVGSSLVDGAKVDESGNSINVGGLISSIGNYAATVSDDKLGKLTIDNIYADIDIYYVQAKPTYTNGVATAGDVPDQGRIGGIAGWVNSSYTNISNVVYVGTVEASGTQAAGIVGRAASTRGKTYYTIDNCINKGEIKPIGKYFVGGKQENTVAYVKAYKAGMASGSYTADLVVGSTTYKASATKIDLSSKIQRTGGIMGEHGGAATTGTISNCENYAAISGQQRMAGIVGSTTNGKLTISGCVNHANVTTTGSNAGGIAGNATATSVTITNCLNEGVVSGSSSSGGIAGQISPINSSTPNTVIVSGCVNRANVTATGANAAGIVGSITANTLKMENCLNEGEITANSAVAGIAGLISITGATSNTISNCDNATSGVIIANATGDALASGVVGKITVGATSTTTITGCDNLANIQNSGQYTAGIISAFWGTADNTSPTLIIDSCNNAGDFSLPSTGETTGRWTGGIAGYIYGNNTAGGLMAKCEIKNCTNTGDFENANRCSAGIVAHIQRCKTVLIENCTVDADIDFDVRQASNQYVGGICARIDLPGSHNVSNTTATISGCTVKGSLTVEESVSTNVKSAAILGSANKGTIAINNCVVAAKMQAVDFTNSSDILAYYIGLPSSATFSGTGNKYYNVAGSNGTDGVGSDAISATYANKIVPVGVQYRINSDNTADIRYVFGLSGLNEGVDNALGFDVDIKQIVDDVVVPRDTMTAYAPYIYESLNGTDANGNPVEYVAGTGDYAGVKYFAVVTLKGVPQAEYVVENDTIHIKNGVVEVTPFFQENEESGKASFSKATMLSNKTLDIPAENFTYDVPDKFAGVSGIVTTIDPLKYNDPDNKITNVVDGTHNQDLVLNVSCGACASCRVGYAMNNKDQIVWTGSDCTCTNCALKWNAHGAISLIAIYGVEGMLPHFYIDYNNYCNESGDLLEDTYNYYYSFTFTVEEAGVYDFCFRIRNKDGGSGYNERYALIQINDQEFDQQTRLHFNVAIDYVVTEEGDAQDLVGNCNKTLEESYIVGYSAELKAGENTITFRLPYGKSSALHIRDILIVKAN